MLKNTVYKLLLIFLDLLFLIAVFYITKTLKNHIEIPKFDIFEIKKFSFVFLTIIFLLYYEGIYKYRYDFWQESLKIFKALMFSYLIILSIATLTKTNVHYSRIFISVYFLVALCLFPFYKRFIKYILFKILGVFKQNVIIFGKEKQKKTLYRELKENWYLGMKYNSKKYDSVFITSQNIEVNQLNSLIDKYAYVNKELFLVPYVTDINFAHSNILEYTNIRLNSIVVENKLLNKLNIYIKNVVDYLLAILILPVFLVVHSVIFLLIKYDSKGKVFFKQKRVGQNGRVFYVYKYRTMYEDSDLLLKKYLATYPDEIEYYEQYHKYKNDPRITKVGKFLRSTSLDELPQFINVLRGEMSIVGPRPYMLDELYKLGKYKEFILKVKPGITGLWQVSGRNELTFKERNELEVWYIKNWSLWLDFVILVKTIKVVVLKIGAK